MSEERRNRGTASSSKTLTAAVICALFLGSGYTIAAEAAPSGVQGVWEQMQSSSVTVTVVDTNGEAIIGANVIVKGTTGGVFPTLMV